jgi:uncharacterized membrane protein
MVEQLTSSVFLTPILIFFFILIFAEILALYLHVAGFTLVEVVLMVCFPLLAYFSALPVVDSAITEPAGGIFGTVAATARVFNVPIIHLGSNVIGVNAVGFFIPTIITTKMLVQRRIPWKQFCLLTVIIAAVTYLYTLFHPTLGMVVYLFAIPPILAAAIAFMFWKMKGAGEFNPALLSYAGATIGVLVGADLLNLYRFASHNLGEPVLVSVGGGSVLDAVFLAGIVALFADLVFRSQEENILGRLEKVFQRGGQR